VDDFCLGVAKKPSDGVVIGVAFESIERAMPASRAAWPKAGAVRRGSGRVRLPESERRP